jgi:hypothetical protein
VIVNAIRFGSRNGRASDRCAANARQTQLSRLGLYTSSPGICDRDGERDHGSVEPRYFLCTRRSDGLGILRLGMRS